MLERLNTLSWMLGYLNTSMLGDVTKAMLECLNAWMVEWLMLECLTVFKYTDRIAFALVAKLLRTETRTYVYSSWRTDWCVASLWCTNRNNTVSLLLWRINPALLSFVENRYGMMVLNSVLMEEVSIAAAGILYCPKVECSCIQGFPTHAACYHPMVRKQSRQSERPVGPHQHARVVNLGSRTVLASCRSTSTWRSHRWRRLLPCWRDAQSLNIWQCLTVVFVNVLSYFDH